jgi:hypothetical protein
MSERYGAEIIIGGKIHENVVAELLDLLNEYDGNPTINDYITDDHISFYYSDARYGQFDEIEQYCRNNKIPYNRYSEGYYDINPELEVYRPDTEGTGIASYHCSSEKIVLITHGEILKIADTIRNMTAETFEKDKKDLLTFIDGRYSPNIFEVPPVQIINDLHIIAEKIISNRNADPA